MPSLLSSLNIAIRSMLSQQMAMQVTEHNVANANTPGYRRQEAVLMSAEPYTMPTLRGLVVPGQIGTGVMVDRIRQYNLEFFDGRYRRELAESQRWDMEHTVLQQVELSLAETSEDGLIPKLDAFWSSWLSLSNEPTNMALRADLREKADAVATALNWRAETLVKIQSDQNATIVDRVAEINSIAEQIARLNVEIIHVKSAGSQPNDLMDQRDVLLDRLSEISGSVANIQDNGEAIVSIGGHALVLGAKTFSLNTTDTAIADIYWVEDGKPFIVNSGELAGLIHARDNIIDEQLTGLNQLAEQLVVQVNSIHSTGYSLNSTTPTGHDFFDAAHTTAFDIRLDADIQTSLYNIAAAENPDAPGEGNLAIAIANIKDTAVIGVETINQFYTHQVTQLGIDILLSKTRANDRQDVADSLTSLRESVSGVNLDEEAANLMKYQRAFQAATRMITVVDEMMDRIINGMGVGGR